MLSVISIKGKNIKQGEEMKYGIGERCRKQGGQEDLTEKETCEYRLQGIKVGSQ